jgi:cell division protein FtsW
MSKRTTTARTPLPPAGGTYLLLVATVVLLNVIGVVMVLSASSVLSLTDYGSAWYFFQRQLLWTVLAGVGFVVAMRLDYHWWRKATFPLLVGSAALLVLVLVPQVGQTAGGAQRWLGSGMVRFQPTEIAKLAVLLYAADLLTRRADELADWRRVLRPVVLVAGGFGLLVCLQPDLDSAVLIALIAASILIAGGVRMRHLMVIGGTGVALAAALAIAEPYRRARVFTFLHPTADASNTGYQIVQSLIALGEGGITGVGLGAGRSKWLFLPNAHTDFIFSIIGEELGLIGTLIVLGLFVAFAALGIRTAMQAPDRFGMLLATGVTIWVVAQAAVNIGGVVGLLPVSGIPLPFVSFGGSALLFTMVAAGILASVARRSGAPLPRRHEPRRAAAAGARGRG